MAELTAKIGRPSTEEGPLPLVLSCASEEGVGRAALSFLLLRCLSHTVLRVDEVAESFV
jgi:hypothetical protein